MRTHDAAGAPPMELEDLLGKGSAGPSSEGAPNALAGFPAALILGAAPFFWNPPAWIIALMQPQISTLAAPAFLASHPWPLVVGFGRNGWLTPRDGRTPRRAGRIGEGRA